MKVLKLNQKLAKLCLHCASTTLRFVRSLDPWKGHMLRQVGENNTPLSFLITSQISTTPLSSKPQSNIGVWIWGTKPIGKGSKNWTPWKDWEWVKEDFMDCLQNATCVASSWHAGSSWIISAGHLEKMAWSWLMLMKIEAYWSPTMRGHSIQRQHMRMGTIMVQMDASLVTMNC